VQFKNVGVPSITTSFSGSTTNTISNTASAGEGANYMDRVKLVAKLVVVATAYTSTTHPWSAGGSLNFAVKVNGVTLPQSLTVNLNNITSGTGLISVSTSSTTSTTINPAQTTSARALNVTIKQILTAVGSYSGSYKNYLSVNAYGSMNPLPRINQKYTVMK